MIKLMQIIKYGKQIGKTAKNGNKAFKKIVKGENIVTVIDKNKNVVKTLKSKTDVLWNGAIEKRTGIYDSKGICTDSFSSYFCPNLGTLQKSHYKFGDVKKDIVSEILINGNKMSFKQVHYETKAPSRHIVKTVSNDNIEITNPKFRYGNSGDYFHAHKNKYANDVYKAAKSIYYNEWMA